MFKILQNMLSLNLNGTNLCLKVPDSDAKELMKTCINYLGTKFQLPLFDTLRFIAIYLNQPMP